MTFSISAKIQDGSQDLITKINAFLQFTQKFKMVSKSGGKVIFATRFFTYPTGQKFRNRSISHQDKCFYVSRGPKILESLSRTEISVFTLHAEIQDGRQKWWESDFYEKSPVHSGHPGGR